MKSTSIFDDGKGYGSLTNLKTFTDCTVVKRDDQWWMFACGDEKTQPEIHLLSAFCRKERRFRQKAGGSLPMRPM